MRLLLSLGLVLSMNGMDIERAQQMARGRESERQQFHRRYVIDLQDATVTQFEVITEFRRLVLITEEHILRGDWMFSRGTRRPSRTTSLKCSSASVQIGLIWTCGSRMGARKSVIPW